jgi:uncharacterized membrane protein YkvA (DUF1232 family)
VKDITKSGENKDQPGFFQEIWQQIRLVYKLLLDPEVPIYLKVLPFVAVVYLLLPFDFLPDVIPGLGQLDDLTILIIGAKMFIDMAPQEVVQRHLRSLQSASNRIAREGTQGDDMGDEDADIIEGIIIEGQETGEPPRDNEQ